MMLFTVSDACHGRRIVTYRPTAGHTIVVEYGPDPMVGGVISNGTFLHWVFDSAGVTLPPFTAGVFPM
jgi:hypothetical protein